MELLVDMLKTALPLFVSFAVTAVFTPLVIWIATRRGWVASPREDRWHQRPTALMGGIGIFAGTLASWAVFIRDPALLAVVVPAAAIFVLGVLDDRLNLKPHVKLVAQLAAGISALLMGLQFDAIPQWIAVGLALFWLTGITNGINLLDNMDGLAAGVGGISALAMAVYGVANGDGTTVPTAFGLAGACFGFLVFNFHPARIFMGDCGSLFIGFALAALAINGTHRTAPNLVLALLVPVATLAIPIFDTALVSAARTFHGRPISRGGRDHLSHRLVSLGLSERRTVLVLYALTAIFGSLSIATTTLPLLVVLVLSVLLFLALAILGLFLGHIKVYPKSEDLPPHARLLSQNPSYKRQLAQVFCDMILIPMAFLGAHLLRFEAVLTLEIRDTIFQVLPVVLGLKLIGMLACRAYRGLWRYAEPVDAVTAMLGSTAGSLLSALAIGLWTQFHGISRAALIIDWLVFTCLAVGVRMSYVVLRELFGMVPPTEGARVLLLGAGPEC
ncbi:MAG: hypothetical protein FJX77_06635, partial [Armatimonadetes bacterium]|nr:hypothetical protein [Armatimonadota bacterium]